MILRTLFLLLKFKSVPLLITRLFFDKDVSWKSRFILILTIIYVILPFDIIHDILPVIGQVDDLAAILIGMALFLISIPWPLINKHLKRTRTDQNRENHSPPPGKIIEGEFRHVENSHHKSK